MSRRRLPTTPRSQVRNALRQLWLRSRERATALKAAGYACEVCGKKQSRRKGHECNVVVHHHKGIPSWETLVDEVYRHLLCRPEYLLVLCVECHDLAHTMREEQS